MRIALLMFIVIGGCGTLQAPKSVAGNVPVAIANGTSQGMCVFRMTPGRSSDAGENWVSRTLEPGVSRSVSLQPGSYSLYAQAGDTLADGCSATFVAESRVDIDGPTQIVVGQNADIGPVAGARRVEIPVRERAQAPGPCIQSGDQQISGQPCCSGKNRMAGHELVCE